MMNDAQLKARDAGRDVGAELLQAVRELSADQAARKTTFEPLADGSVRRTVLRADGSVEKQSVLMVPYEVCSNRQTACLNTFQRLTRCHDRYTQIAAKREQVALVTRGDQVCRAGDRRRKYMVVIRVGSNDTRHRCW